MCGWARAIRSASIHHPRDRRAAGSSSPATASIPPAKSTGHNHDGVYVPLDNAVGSIWDQLKTIDRINTEIGGDLTA